MWVFRNGGIRRAALVLSALAFVAMGGAAWAHSGGTDSRGCHMNHKTGTYHCH